MRIFSAESAQKRKKRLNLGLPGGRGHGYFSQMWQYKNFGGRGKSVAVSGCKVAVNCLNVAVKNYSLCHYKGLSVEQSSGR